MALNLAELLQGSLNVIFVLISIIVGLTILSRYFKHKKYYYIIIGIIWIGISSPWMHGALAFIIYFFDPLMLETAQFITIRFIIAYTPIPIITTLWFIVFSDLVYPKKKTIFVSLIVLVAFVCELLFFTLLIVDQANLIGIFTAPFAATYRPFTRFTLIFFLGVALISFLIFASHSLHSEDPKIRLKGKFLIIAFLTFTLCAVLDSFAIFLTQPFLIVLIRVLFIFSAIEFYFGWILPEFVARIFIKTKE